MQNLTITMPFFIFTMKYLKNQFQNGGYWALCEIIKINILLQRQARVEYTFQAPEILNVDQASKDAGIQLSGYIFLA